MTTSREAVTITLAVISLFLYGSLAVVSYYYYRKFRSIQLNASAQYYKSNLGKFDDAKVIFFLVLCISALLDIPTYIGCIAQNGPDDCVWNGVAYELFWFMHLIAVCGYAYTIMIPCVLWSDMINKKDGKLFSSKYPSDFTKRFFQAALILYILNTTVDIFWGFIDYKQSDSNAYQENSMVDAICTLLEPMIIFGITVGCFWCSVRLQIYVSRARLGVKTELRFLLYMNLTMIVIMCSYLARALYVLRLVSFFPKSYTNAFRSSYFVWLLCTHWLPYTFCSFCLVLMMRASGEEVAARQGQARVKSPSESETLTYDSSSGMTSKVNLKLVATSNNFPHDGDSSLDGRSILSQSEGVDDDSLLSESLLTADRGYRRFPSDNDGQTSGSYSPSFRGFSTERTTSQQASASPSFWNLFGTSPGRPTNLQQQQHPSSRVYSRDALNPLNSDDRN